MILENFPRVRTTSIVAAGFLLGSCATLLACRAEDFVKIFAFDRQQNYLYFGPKTKPDEIIGYSDPKLDKMLCMTVTDWDAVKNKLATCN